MKTFQYLVVGYLFLNGFCACGQTPNASNSPSKTTSRQARDEGAKVWGTFEGRAKCDEMQEVLNVPLPENCELLKWAITIYKNPQTNSITSYKWEGSLFREKPQTGNCKLLKGYMGDSEAKVIELEAADSGPSLYLLVGDENVLFVLDKNKKLMKGDDYVSFTFSRVVN